MARWQTEADAAAETAGGGGQQFTPAPRGIYTIQVADYKDGMTAGGKNKPRPMVTLTCEIADDGPEFGKKVWVNVVQIPKGEKGHGIMVHTLHAFGMSHDGDLDFDTCEFQGRTAKALLGIKPYVKVVDGREYTNMANFVEELYSPAHPEPTGELPPPKETPKGNPNLSHAAGHETRKPVATAGTEEVPF